MFTQIVRSAAQSVWAAFFSLAFVAEALSSLGLDEAWAMGVAMTVTMAVVTLAGRELPKLHPVFGVIINVINKAPSYGEAPGVS